MSRPTAAPLLVGMLLLPGCALGGGLGWGTGTPDPMPREIEVSVRGPLVRESQNVFGGELGLEIGDDGVARVRRGGALYAHRFSDRRLGVDGPWLEVGGAAGGGRTNFDPEGEHLGFYTGPRLEMGTPVCASTAAHPAEVRLFFVRLDVFLYGHGDVILGPAPTAAGQAGLGLRVAGSTDADLRQFLGNLP